jgi:hypothetical protein
VRVHRCITREARAPYAVFRLPSRAERAHELQSRSAGKDLPQDFNVIIEIPAQSDPVKYEADKDLGPLVVDRFIGTGMRYPASFVFLLESSCLLVDRLRYQPNRRLNALIDVPVLMALIDSLGSRF